MSAVSFVITTVIPCFSSGNVFLRRRFARRASGVEVELDRLLAGFRVIGLTYTIWHVVSRLVPPMGRLRPKPTTCRSERVLVARRYRNWCTHIVTGMTGLTIVCIVLLGRRVGIWVAGIHVFVWRSVDVA
jgi:hypothetical protein